MFEGKQQGVRVPKLDEAADGAACGSQPLFRLQGPDLRTARARDGFFSMINY